MSAPTSERLPARPGSRVELLVSLVTASRAEEGCPPGWYGQLQTLDEGILECFGPRPTSALVVRSARKYARRDDLRIHLISQEVAS